jgi:hypothetical protein
MDDDAVERRRPAAPNQAGLHVHMANVVANPNPAWVGQGQRSLINTLGAWLPPWLYLTQAMVSQWLFGLPRPAAVA